MSFGAKDPSALAADCPTRCCLVAGKDSATPMSDFEERLNHSLCCFEAATVG